jgi:hypothetical protein
MTETPTIVFLIPFAPRRMKSKWEIACAQLRQTLASIRNSVDENFCVVVAGTDAPDFDITLDERFYFITLPPQPSAHSHPVVAGVLDKMAKVTAAWEHAKTRWNPRYAMKLDADDFVSSRLVRWLAQNGGDAGYLISNGWLWETGARYFIQRTETLDRVCGSCLVIRNDFVERTGPFLTETEGVVLSEENSHFARADLYSLVPGSGISTLLANDSHQRWAAQLAYLGYALTTVPFPAVIYRRGNLDSNTWASGNYSLRRRFHSFRMLVGSLRRTRLVTARLRKEFILPTDGE